MRLIFLLFIAFNCYAEPMKILTLNAWTMPVVGQKISERAKIIGHNLDGYDLVGMQEVWLPWHRDIIQKYAPENFKIVFKPVFKVGLGSGLLNFSSFKVIKKDFVKFQSCLGIDCMAAKGILFTRIELASGKVIDIFNTHLQAGGKHSEARKGQLSQIASFIKSYDQGNPTILMGDFNIKAKSPEYEILQKTMLGFKDLWDTFHPDLDGHTADGVRNPWINSNNQSRIDYIFIKDGKELNWKVNDVKLAFDYPMSYKGEESLMPSDHFGIEADLDI